VLSLDEAVDAAERAGAGGRGRCAGPGAGGAQAEAAVAEAVGPHAASGQRRVPPAAPLAHRARSVLCGFGALEGSASTTPLAIAGGGGGAGTEEPEFPAILYF
jgi:hypothetical protein